METDLGFAGLPRLTPRLALIASMVDRGSFVLDVGTDHGYLPIYLVGRGICRGAAASDINEGPVAAARRNAARAGLSDRIKISLGDGTRPAEDCGADTVIMAGMGGEVMAGIIERSEICKKDGVRLLLQPMTKHEELRGYLNGHGYVIDTERLCREGRRLYLVLSARAGKTQVWDDARCFFGERLFDGPEPLAGEYLAARRAELEKELNGLRRAREPDCKRCAAIERMLARADRLAASLDAGAGR